MKENTEHYTDTLGYLMEQTVIYLKEKGEQVFKELKLEITLEQLITIDTILANPGICQMDLSRLILRERSYTSRILDGLEKRGFVERKISKKNKRLVNELHVTAEAQTFLLQHRETLKRMSEDVYKDISEEEFYAIRNGILKMKECVSKFTVIPL